MKTVALIALAGAALGAVVPKDTVRLYSTTPSCYLLHLCPSQPLSLPLPSLPCPSFASPNSTLLARPRLNLANPIQKRDLKSTEIQIEGLTYGGSGCPSSSVGSSISDDKTVVTLIFDQYIAAVGPKVMVTDNRKNCQLNLKLKYPGGYQYSILSADYRGYAALEAGVTGQQRSTYYFSGQTAQVSALPYPPT